MTKHSLRQDGIVNRNIYTWQRFELNDVYDKNIPFNLNFAGTYIVFVKGEAVYVGQAKNLKPRVLRHFKMGMYSNHWKTPWGSFNFITIAVKREKRRFERLMTEQQFIYRLKPKFNKRSL